jgi:ribosomal protein S18 acetylase RimI-like enzyme
VTGIDHPTVRAANAEDLYAFADDVNQFGLLRDRLCRRLEGKGELLVASCDGHPVGHLYIWLEEAEELELRVLLPFVPLLMNLWVREDLRGRGIGTALIVEAERRLRERGHAQVALGVAPDNKRAVKLYLGLHYDPWEHPDIKTDRAEFSETGEPTRHPEVCAVLVKNLAEAEHPQPTQPPALPALPS